MYRKWIKRLLDIIISGAGLLILSPLLLILWILIRCKLGSPVLFTQERPGRRERIFKLYKFRTMTDARDEKGELLPDEVRLTKFGRLLRSTSLDELPEMPDLGGEGQMRPNEAGEIVDSAGEPETAGADAPETAAPEKAEN